MNALNLMAKPTAPKCYRRLDEISKVKHLICIYDPNANTGNTSKRWVHLWLDESGLITEDKNVPDVDIPFNNLDIRDRSGCQQELTRCCYTSFHRNYRWF